MCRNWPISEWKGTFFLIPFMNLLFLTHDHPPGLVQSLLNFYGVVLSQFVWNWQPAVRQIVSSWSGSLGAAGIRQVAVT